MALSSRFLFKILIFLIFCLVVSVVLIGVDKIFGIFSSPRVISVSPANSSQDISLNAELIINFDKPLNRRQIQHTISPEILGEWKFENPLVKNHLFKTLVFKPAVNFEPNTNYQVKLENIKGFSLAKNNYFSFIFKTKENEQNQVLATTTNSSSSEPEITLIDAPLYWQKYRLSCEAASLRMALAAKEVYISEDDIMGEIGYDATPHKNNVWGDPYSAYVGDINGKICDTGYGVYWEPVAKAANNWIEAEAFSGWDLQKLTDEIKSGNPVIMWGTLPVDALHDCSWQTPQGKDIKTFKETHVRLVVGFIGDENNPEKIILNDPLSGKLYWDTSYFLKNWETFNYSGVVVR